MSSEKGNNKSIKNMIMSSRCPSKLITQLERNYQNESTKFGGIAISNRRDYRYCSRKCFKCRLDVNGDPVV